MFKCFKLIFSMKKKTMQNHSACITILRMKHHDPHYEENYNILILCFWEWPNKNLNQGIFFCFIKTKFSLQNTMVKKIKRQTTDWGNIFETIYSIKELFSEYIQNLKVNLKNEIDNESEQTLHQIRHTNSKQAFRKMFKRIH